MLKMDRDILTVAKYVLIAVAACALAIWVYGLRIIPRYRFRHIPGPTPPWLLGDVGAFRKLGQPGAFKLWGERYGPGLHAVHLAGMSILSVGDPDTARKVLYGGARPYLLNGDPRPSDKVAEANTSVLWTRGREWRDQRAAWQPMFYTGSLEKYVPIFDQAAALLTKEMSWVADEGRFIDVHAIVQDLGLSVICQAAFGLDCHLQKAGKDESELSEEDKERAESLRRAAQGIFLSQEMSLWVIAARVFPFLVPALRLVAERFPDAPLRRGTEAREVMTKAATDLVQDHKRSVEASGGAPQTQGPRKARKGVEPGSFIDLLVQARSRITGEGFSDVCIVQQVLTMIVGGFETTANMLSFTLYLLARPCNAEKQAKVAAEVDALGKDWVASFTDLEDKLPYLDAVLKESLRLYPPGHVLFREAEENMTVEGYKVPRGSCFFISTYAIHNDPRVWGDSVATFLPERWLTPDPVAAKKAKNSFFGFGDGPRVCPGSRFALMEAKMALVRVFQKFTLELQPGQEPLATKDALTLSPKDGVFVRPVCRR